MDLAPPAFHETSNLRRKACAAGLDPAHWYAVEWESAVPKGKVVEVRFQGASLALYRGQDGELHALENRCAHRQVKLSHGFVEGCQLKCVYHGWTYDGDGRLASIPHELFGRSFPAVRLRSFPVRVRHGLIWVFFGDPALAAEREIPDVPELADERSWAHVPIDFLWRAHPTLIVNNVMDSTHVATLHGRRFRTRSFRYGPVTHCEAERERVLVSHKIEVDPGGLVGYVAKNIAVDTQTACFEYPYLWVSVGGVYKLWNFLLPIDERTTRVFMLSCAERVRIPFTPWLSPAWLARALLPLARRILVRPLFDEDGLSTAYEQEGYEAHFDRPSLDLHPAPRLCYQLTIRKWEEHLAASERAQRAG